MNIQKKTQPLSSEQVTFFRLQTNDGLEAEICTLGASLTRLSFPDRHGKPANIVLRLATPASCLQNPYYAGATLGPNAGRIGNHRLLINGETHLLSANDGNNNLHGGYQNVSFQNWGIKEVQESQNEASLTMEYMLPDGQDGFPGNRKLNAQYHLTEDGILTLHYTAETDKVTYLNLSNHSYFNLSGDFTRSALTQQLQIFADSYIANDSCHLPQEILPVAKSPFDFRKPRTPAEQLSAFPNDIQLKNAMGYNNGFPLTPALSASSPAAALVPAAVLYDSGSGRCLRLYTDAPCLILYSGGYLNGHPFIDDNIHGAIPSSCGAALALEAQDFPNAPGCPLFPCHFLTPEQTYNRTIQYCFDTLAAPPEFVY